MSRSAFVSRTNTSTLSNLTFQVNPDYEMPISLLTSHISQFQTVLSFASKLIELEGSLVDDFTRNALFAEYLKGIEQKHTTDLLEAEKRILSESTGMITPLFKKLTDLESSHKKEMERKEEEYSQQIRLLQKTIQGLESTAATSKGEIESAYQRETRQLQRRIADLEVDLLKTSKSETLIREQCQVDSERLIKEIKEASRELIKAKEESLQQREAALKLKEEDYTVKLQRSSSSAYRGQDGEKFFAALAKEKMNWTLEYTGDVPHSCDYSATIQGLPTFFEVKHYTHSIPQKEITKFLRDMKEHPEVGMGVFISLNTAIQGRSQDQHITMDWIHGSQCVLYIQSCVELDIDHVFSVIDQVTRLSGIFSRFIKSQEEGTMDQQYQSRIDNAKVYLQNAVSRITALIRRIQADKKDLLQRIETNSSHSILELKQQSSEVSMAIQILLNDYEQHVEEDSEPLGILVVPSEPKARKKSVRKQPKQQP